MASVPPALHHGAVIGSAGEGRFSTATRAELIADCDVGASTGALEDNSRQLSALIGRFSRHGIEVERGRLSMRSKSGGLAQILQ